MRIGGLRPRIAGLVALVVLACVAVAFVAVYRESSRQLTHRASEDVRQDMDALTRVVKQRPQTAHAVAARVRQFFRDPPFRPTNHVTFVVVKGSPALTNEPELLGLPTPESGESRTVQSTENSAGRKLLAAPVGTSSQTLPDAGKLHVLVTSQRLSGGRTARLGIGEPTSGTERAQRSVRDAFLLAGALATLAALLGGMLVASRFVAPLRRMARVAASVDGGELHRRMHEEPRGDEVGVLAESFNHMLDRLEDAFERQTDFVADASHELRTPLTVIRGQLEVLARQPHPEREDVERVERLVRTEVDRMERLVEDLLLLAQAGADGFLRPVAVPLPEFLHDLVRGQPDGGRGSVRLEEPPAVAIVADPDRLAQALRNLLNNALDHTPDGGRTELAADVAGDVVRFCVDDDGDGVQQADRERVFERFHRIDNGRPAQGGAGLGLAIVRAIAEAHGGHAYVVDGPLGGARFVIELPRSGPGPAASPK
jgi:two-component system OmpR family sensor kinase